MSYLVFPRVRGLSWTITRTPQWDTLAQRMSSGKEFRLNYWQYPLWKWELQYNYLKDNPADLPPGYSTTDLAVLQGFFNQNAGQFNVFLFDDYFAGTTPGAGEWDSVTAQPVATGDGVTTTFQLLRTTGGFPEAIQTPYMADGVSAHPSVFLNGVLQSYGSSYSIDGTGNIIFASPPGVGVRITWTGSYYWPVRFGTDDLDIDAMMYQLWKLKKITLQQVRL